MFIIKNISTVFSIGKIPLCPGTWGSLSTYMFLPIILECSNLVFFVSISILFVISTIVTDIYSKSVKKSDPKEVVIDELIGQAIVLKFSTNLITDINSIQNIVFFIFPIPFLLFRLFDIKKPFIISIVDKKIHGGLGIMLDDVLAALFSSLPFIIYKLFF